MIERYLKCRYRPGGRGPDEVDCWGLARMVRHEVFGLPLLASYGAVDPDDKPTASQSFGEVKAGLSRVPPRPGALAICTVGSLDVHCGICIEIDGRLAVLEADEGVNVRRVPLRQFTRRFTRVEFFL